MTYEHAMHVNQLKLPCILEGMDTGKKNLKILPKKNAKDPNFNSCPYNKASSLARWFISKEYLVSQMHAHEIHTPISCKIKIIGLIYASLHVEQRPNPIKLLNTVKTQKFKWSICIVPGNMSLIGRTKTGLTIFQMCCLL